MATQEQILHLQSEQLGLDERMGEMRKHALRCVILGLVFAEEHPDEYELYQQLEQATAENAETLQGLEELREHEVAAPQFDACIGEEHEVGFEVMDGDVLYQVLQRHTFAENWRPSVSPSLFKAWSRHAGDESHPIPFILGMAIENGKHYTEGGVEYVCTRDSGVPIYNHLTDLVNIYVALAS